MVRSNEDEDSLKDYRSPKPATQGETGRRTLLAGDSGQFVFFVKLSRPVRTACL